MNLKAGDEVEFTISQTHWWGWWPEPFWRFDGSDENEANKLNGGDNMKKVKVMLQESISSSSTTLSCVLASSLSNSITRVKEQSSRILET